MKVKRIQNVSNQKILLECKEGIEINLPPGAVVFDVDVVTDCINKIKDKVLIVTDLGEINEHNYTRKLFD